MVLTTTNPRLKDLVNDLNELAKEKGAPLWSKAAEMLSDKKSRAKINLSRIDRNADENDVVLVPGKVLGTGELTKKVTISAFKISQAAKKKIKAEGDYLTIRQLMEDNPQGSDVRLLK